MNLLEAYRAMYNFLDSFYWRNESDELCNLVSSMPLVSDYISVDSGSICDWKKAVCQTVKSPKLCEKLKKECEKNITKDGFMDCLKKCYFDAPLKNTDLTSEMIYESMIAYLRNWASIGTDGTVENLWMQFEKAGSQTAEWQRSLNAVINNSDDPCFHLN